MCARSWATSAAGAAGARAQRAHGRAWAAGALAKTKKQAGKNKLKNKCRNKRDTLAMLTTLTPTRLLHPRTLSLGLMRHLFIFLARALLRIRFCAIFRRLHRGLVRHVLIR